MSDWLLASWLDGYVKRMGMLFIPVECCKEGMPMFRFNPLVYDYDLLVLIQNQVVSRNVRTMCFLNVTTL